MFSNGKGEQQEHCSEGWILFTARKIAELESQSQVQLSSNAHAQLSTLAFANLPNSASFSPQL